MYSPDTQKFTLIESEFDYLQRMLDYGISPAQALLELHPELVNNKVNLRESIITVQKYRCNSAGI